MLWSKKPGFCSKITNGKRFSVLASLTGVPHSSLGERNSEILNALKLGRWMEAPVTDLGESRDHWRSASHEEIKAQRPAGMS